MNEEKKAVMIKVAELYCEPNEGEGLFLSGLADQGRAVLRPVKEMASDKHPDHELFLIARGQHGGETEAPKEIRVGVLWKGKTKNGDVYASGTFWQSRCVIFRNSFKEGPEDPDFILYVTGRQRTKAADSQDAPTADDAEITPF